MAERTTPADVAAFPRGARTRFAPAPTGFLHLGHVANAIWVWGVAGATDGRVLLRIEDHDRGAQPSGVRGRRCSRTSRGWGSRADDGPDPPVGRRRAVPGGPRTAPRRGPRLRLRLLALDVRGVVARARASVARTRLSGRLPASRARRPGPARGARRRLGTLDGCHRRAVRRRGRRGCRRPADPRSRRELDVRVRGRRRRPAPGRSTW